MKKIFVCPTNDAEAVAIVDMLQKNGETVLTTGQTWGASWENLEESVKEQLQSVKAKVYGIELQGDLSSLGIEVNNIDHHCYEGDDRSNPKTSIEQVADIIGTNLTTKELFIAANDKGFIPGMEKLAQEFNLNEKDTQNIISEVRAMDRAAQGITQEMEDQAIEALNNIEKTDDLTIVNLSHSKCATITDRLYGQYDNLLIISGDGETNFYGDSRIVKALQDKFEGWSGGDLDNGSGFWGGYADQNEIKNTAIQLSRETVRCCFDKDGKIRDEFASDKISNSTENKDRDAR